MLRSGLLEGVTVAVAGEPAPARRCEELGAAVVPLETDLQDEKAVATAAQRLPAAEVLVCAADDLDAAFIATRVLASAWIAGGRGGKVVLVAPADDAPQQAALENLARTLSIEWARYDIRPTAILPRDGGAGGEVAELVAFLASAAGDYYSGCAFSVGTPP